MTIVLVTHVMDETERLCDRLAVIARGRVIATGTPAELTGSADGERTFRMLLPGPLPHALRLTDLPEVHTIHEVAGEIEVTGGPAVLPATVIALNRHGLVPVEMHTVTRSLEDAFVELITHDTGQEPIS